MLAYPFARWCGPGFSLLAFLLIAASSAMSAAEGGDATVPSGRMTLPATITLDKLTDLAAKFGGVTVQYSAEKLQAQVRTTSAGALDARQVWAVLQQALHGQGLTTIATGQPASYSVVAVTDAPAQGLPMDVARLDRLPLPPGFAVAVLALVHLNADIVVKSVGALLPNQQSAQVRTLGSDDRHLVIAAPWTTLVELRRMIAVLDRPGMTPAVRLWKPQRSSASAIQAAATGAWTSLQRLGHVGAGADLQVAPDGTQLVMIAAADDLDRLQRLAEDLDRAEPTETRSYHPAHFSIEEVAALLQQLLREPGAAAGAASAGAATIVRDRLTGSLVVTATQAQHSRITELLRQLDATPAATRRQARTLVVKHRPAEELARLVSSMMGTTPQVLTPPLAPAPGATPPAMESRQAGEAGVTLTADPVTNALIAVGDPQVLDQVATLVQRLDQRQSQVDLEVILVTVNSSQGHELGVELTKAVTAGAATGSVQSLFGFSSSGGSGGIDRVLPATFNGVGGVILSPGDYSVVLHALETIADSRSVIRTQVVVANNAKASVKGVLQEPLTSVSTNNVANVVSSNGTTDAGTQVTIKPSISAADYVTLDYTIDQSAFQGESQRNSDGSTIPPPRQSDNVSSVASIPDGFVIALGGLSSQSRSRSESRLPVLGAIPFLGYLFKNETASQDETRFYVFIRANILRHAGFADLKRRSDRQVQGAGLGKEGGPRLAPQLMR